MVIPSFVSESTVILIDDVLLVGWQSIIEGVNGPTSDKGRKISVLTTDKMSKKLPTTNRKNINRLPTWADIINICCQQKDHFAVFSSR